MNNRTRSTLILFTNNYPYGSGESFIENELFYLSAAFDKIYIIPFYNKYQTKRPVPINCQVLDIEGFEKYSPLRTFITHFFTFTFTYTTEFLKEKNKRGFFRSRKTLRSILLQSIYRSIRLNRLIQDNAIDSKSLYYSFWCNDWVTAIGLLKKRKALITRVHGFDLYHDRRENGILPFRNFQLKNIKAMYCVSEYARQYMLRHYPAYSSRYHIAPLFVPDRGENKWILTQETVVVSCSNIIPLKRVEWIAMALVFLNRRVNWIHFGSGISQELSALLEHMPGNIQVKMMGQLSNAQIMDFYKENQVTLFVHASSSEGGIPVAIQEAVSFGIPVIAVEAGGVGEIVNDKTGYLIPGELFTPAYFAEKIEQFLISEKNSPAFRQGIREYWTQYFSAERNYPLFCERLTQIT